MAQLSYYAANDPTAFKRRDGRILTAGVLLLLVGLGLALLAGLWAFQELRRARYGRSDWLEEWTAWLALASSAVTTFVAGYGFCAGGGGRGRSGASRWASGSRSARRS